MVLFTDLPIEIQHRILSFLHAHRDVAALSIQCRSLHALCDMPMRKKYRRLRIDSKDKSLNKAFATRKSSCFAPRYVKQDSQVQRQVAFSTWLCKQRPSYWEPRRLHLPGLDCALYLGFTRTRVIGNAPAVLQLYWLLLARSKPRFRISQLPSGKAASSG
ncbi:unnamed protein product [Aspergillus oryzae RIB40]|uniref:DNA, SC005 n=1 Tax=Aspergillus oryzae (strain ATCC 42149 / RIB 40) TaxID=510516 RepID=Q2UQB0_ASPOR|nr:unnamed protein product [Aspergillus oryzae RIB40]BAE56255.1 unnamed protein product [Aspergillus oryzae RIB40]